MGSKYKGRPKMEKIMFFSKIGPLFGHNLRNNLSNKTTKMYTLNSSFFRENKANSRTAYSQCGGFFYFRKFREISRKMG